AQLRVEGRARVNVNASVRDGRVNGSGKVIGERLALAGLALGGGTVDVSLDDNALKGELALPEARIAASAQGRLDGAVARRAAAPRCELGRGLRQPRPGLSGDAAGRLWAGATLGVPARAPRAARGLGRLEPVRFEMAGERWEAQGPILVRREPGRLTVERLDVAGRLGTATVAGWPHDGAAPAATPRRQGPSAPPAGPRKRAPR